MAAYPYRLPRKCRYRPRRTMSGKEALGVAAAAVAFAAAAGNHAPAGSHGTAAAGVPAAASGTPDLSTPPGWARGLLGALGDPRTSCDVNAVTAWERAEGGGFGNQAAFDPLNLNPGPGAGWPGRPATGAWAFPDAATGLRYTVSTLRNGDYGGILAALRAGDSAQAVCDAVMASPWAASRYYGTLAAHC